MPQLQIIQRRPGFGEELGAALGGGVSQGISSQLNQMFEEKKLNNEQKKFQKLGYPEPLARLAASATVGGKTQVLKEVLDEMRRGTLGTLQPSETKIQPKIAEKEISAEEPEFNISKVVSQIRGQDFGLSPTEKFKRSTERYKTSLPVYQEASTKLRGLVRDKERINILDKLNESGKLPKNFGRLNVDKEGNLRFPFAGTPESQRYVKTLNEFSAGAKETFGARVTNFDLQQYLQRFPTLLNSEEGRRQIAKQMAIVNEINSVYYGNLKKVYDKAGGARNIDADVAESIADQASESKVNKLVKKFDEIGQFSSLPEPSQFKGRTIQDEETGEILKSDGTNWIPIK